MKWTRTVIPTLRDDPQEAEIPSHRLMLRAGLIRRLAGGLYTFLPLGLRALRKVEAIVREEMDRAGALEVLMPALQPREIWDRSKRYEPMGDVMFRLRDRQNREMVLGPTHEEVITDLAAREISSYRQVPKTFYQIQTKFRDEIRPRFGLMRAKEFIMKDAYSFDTGWDEADASYQAMYDAYVRIFDRCGLRTKVVEADTGAMGGKWSHEFMVVAETGEDGIVECGACAYAANLERAERGIGEGSRDQGTKGPRDQGARGSDFAEASSDKPGVAGKPEEVLTPGCKTIEQVAEFLKCDARDLVKTLIYLVDGQPVAVLVRGDRELNEMKLVRALDAGRAELADDPTIVKATGAPVGFAGPVGLEIPVHADQGLRGAVGLVAGGNKEDTHLTGVDLARDAAVGGFHDLVIAREGDACPRCGERLNGKRGIEVGHVFKLGTKYSESFDATYLDENGEKQLLVMGCYGIGVTRTLQSVIEQSSDKQGIVWPLAVAPYRVAVLVMNMGHAESVTCAEALVADLERRGIDTILDDRDERAGVKFKDADLVGFPIRVVVGERGLAEQNVEVKARTQADKQLIPVSEAAEAIAAMCGAEEESKEGVA